MFLSYFDQFDDILAEERRLIHFATLTVFFSVL